MAKQSKKNLGPKFFYHNFATIVSSRKKKIVDLYKSYKQPLTIYDIKVMVIFYPILIIDPCISDVNPITSCSRVVKCVIFKELVTKGITQIGRAHV